LPVDLGHPTVANPSSHPTELTFDLNSTVQSYITAACSRFDSPVWTHELNVLHYEGYGKNLMKHHIFSPDAWVQLVKQLAFHKLFGRLGISYEFAQTRKFQLGRTEVIQSANNERPRLCSTLTHGRTLLNSRTSSPGSFLNTSTPQHGQLTVKVLTVTCSVSNVCYNLVKNFPRSTKTKFSASREELSMSQLSSRYFEGWGYGEVVKDGFGLSYAIGDDYVRWTITNLKGKQKGEELRHYLAEAATEVKRMLEAAERVEKVKL
jgi:carnitine O-acetyltransferase